MITRKRNKIYNVIQVSYGVSQHFSFKIAFRDCKEDFTQTFQTNKITYTFLSLKNSM